MYKRFERAQWKEKCHNKDPNHFRYAGLQIYAPIESDLYEIILTYIKKLHNNGA